VVASSEDPLKRFSEYLAHKGKRITPERETILEVVFSTSEPFDVDQFVNWLSKRVNGRRASRAKVYRTLLDLVEAELLRVKTTFGRELFLHANSA